MLGILRLYSGRENIGRHKLYAILLQSSKFHYLVRILSFCRLCICGLSQVSYTGFCKVKFQILNKE